jgi:hypothetical protein
MTVLNDESERGGGAAAATAAAEADKAEEEAPPLSSPLVSGWTRAIEEEEENVGGFSEPLSLARGSIECGDARRRKCSLALSPRENENGKKCWEKRLFTVPPNAPSPMQTVIASGRFFFSLRLPFLLFFSSPRLLLFRDSSLYRCNSAGQFFSTIYLILSLEKNLSSLSPERERAAAAAAEAAVPHRCR